MCSGHLCAVPFYTEGFQGINYKKKIQGAFHKSVKFWFVCKFKILG